MIWWPRSSPFLPLHLLWASETAEKNGEFLQVLARLYQRERRPDHLAAGRVIADAYTQEVPPKRNYTRSQHGTSTARTTRPRDFATKTTRLSLVWLARCGLGTLVAQYLLHTLVTTIRDLVIVNPHR